MSSAITIVPERAVRAAAGPVGCVYCLGCYLRDQAGRGDPRAMALVYEFHRRRVLGRALDTPSQEDEQCDFAST